MSSPPPMQSDQNKPTSSQHQTKVHEYRQTMYYDKAGVQIAECRRRVGVAHRVEPSSQTYIDFVLYPTDGIQSPSKAHTHDTSYRAVPERRSGECSYPHVTFAKNSSRTRPKPAIIQKASKPTRILSIGYRTTSSFSGEPTPPPTPRLPRLPTPELPQLGEAPFCDCGIRSHVVKRCRSCSKEVDV